MNITDIRIIAAKNKVSNLLLEVAPLVFDEYNLESICGMKSWREQILYKLIDEADRASKRTKRGKP